MINLSYVYLPSMVLENGILFVPDDTSSMLMMRNKSGVFSEDCSMRAVYKVVDGILHLFIYDKEDSIVRDETP